MSYRRSRGRHRGRYRGRGRRRGGTKHIHHYTVARGGVRL